MGFEWIGTEKTDKNGDVFWSVSVRSLVAPLVLRGSLSHGVGGMALNRGVELHTKIQRQHRRASSEYQKEVHYSHVFESGSIRFEISGRVDGLWATQPVKMEEIKTTTSVRTLVKALKSDPFHPYLLQLQTYAYLHYLGNSEIAEVQLLLVSAYDETSQLLAVDFDPEVYRVWLEERLHALHHRLNEQTRFFVQRRKLTGTLGLPFDHPRKGQEELRAWVDEGVIGGKHVLIQAPTGLGKTVAVLLGTLGDALENDRQVFFVTPKNTQHALVAQTAQRFRDNGTPLTTLVIRAREKICFQEEVVCDPEFCPFADRYYDKLSQHDLTTVVAQMGVLLPRTISAWAKEHQVCPYQLSLDLLPLADLVVCDYNYVFSPRSSFFRWDTDRPQNRANLIVDEFHNLHERARDYFSIRLHRSELLEIRKRLEKIGVAVRRRARRWLTDLDRLLTDREDGRDGGSRKISLDPSPFFLLEKRLGQILAAYLSDLPHLARQDPLLELMRIFFDFCHGLRAQDESFVFLYHGPARSACLEIVCCDPSNYLCQQFRPFFAVVGLSATVKPFSFYALLSGLDEKRLVTREFDNPFPKDNCKVLIVPQVSTALRDRDRNAGKIGEALSKILPVKKGNYIVFFPSFAFLRQVAPLIDLKRFRVFQQTPAMSPRHRSKLLAKLEQKTKNVVILAVQGGIFAEGIDLPGDRLIGAVVVGPGLPAYNMQRQCLSDYYSAKYGEGFAFAYVYPGMARSIQAAGRVIRTEEDRGLLVFMDRRFLHSQYHRVFPKFWCDSSPEDLVSNAILSDISGFWRKARNKSARTRDSEVNGS